MLVPAVVVVLGAACSSSSARGGNDQGAFDTDGGDAAKPACGGLRCSRDLHAVIDDCTLDTVTACADDQGCAVGRCVAACESAASAEGSIGCSFYTVPPDSQATSDGSCYAAFIANTWSTPVHVEAELGGEPLDVSKSIYRAKIDGAAIAYERIEGAIPAGELGIVFLSEDAPGPDTDRYLECPAGTSVAWRGTLPSHKTSRYRAFHLKTDAPVSAYSIFPYGGAKSYVPAATLLLPTPSWQTNYILVDGWQRSAGPPFIQIVAAEDGTEVRMRPNVDVRGGVGVEGAIRGAVARWTLNRGEVLELMQDERLAGSPLEASHPVAVFGGNECAFIPDTLACDSLHQQIPPIKQWSWSYSAVPYRSRRQALAGASPAAESVFWMIVGAADDTVLRYEPAPPPGSPSTLASGDVISFRADAPFVVKSQDEEHPFYLAVHMSGSQAYQTLGDPDFVNIVPDDQLLDRYVFFLDHTYAWSNLTVVRRKDAKGFHDVTIDCLGPVTTWQPLGSDGSAEYAFIDMTVNRTPVDTPLGKCGYGRHEASSSGPFALYVWGLDDDASYGFPAGAGSRPTTTFTIPVR